MPIAVQCRFCLRRFQAPDKALGKSGKCPNCGNQIAIEPSIASQVAAAVAPEPVAEPKRESASHNLLLIGGSSLVAATVIGVAIGWAIAKNKPEVVVPKSVVSQSADSVTSRQDTITPEVAGSTMPLHPGSEDAPGEVKKGLGLTLDEFKRDVPIGKSWKLLSDTKRDDGTVAFQLISTTMSNVVLLVSGNPDDLDEVSVTFAATAGQQQSDTFVRITLVAMYVDKYSNWTAEELGLFWKRLIQVGAGNETEFRIQKNGHEFWVVPIGVTDGTLFTTGVIVKPKSTAPTLQEWLDDHPVPVDASGDGTQRKSSRGAN